MVEPKIVAGRASRTGIFDLFGYDLKDYDELFEEKLGLLLELNKTERITWSGKYRPELRNMKIFQDQSIIYCQYGVLLVVHLQVLLKRENKVCQ